MVTFMKKILLSVIVLLSILTSFIGCKFGIANDYASQELKRPEVEEIDSGIAIRLPVPSDPVSSILIYRYEEEIKTEESSVKTPEKSVTHRSTKDNKLASSDIIGYINVEKLKSSDVFSYFFEDKLVELNKKYEYKARYTYKDSTQKYTKWSKPVDRINNKNPAYTPTEGPILAEFNKDEMELTFQLEPVKVEDNYRYSMIITAKPNKNEEKYVTQLFEITAPTMYLTKVLPSSFLEATGEVWLAGVVENEYLAFTDNKEKKEESLQEKENESEKTKNDTTPETSAGEVIDENITEITEESENSNGNSNNDEVDKDGDEKEETTPEASAGEVDENGDEKEDNNSIENNDSQTETTVVMKKIPTKIGFSKKIPVEIEGIPSKEEGSKIIDADITYDDNSYGIDFSKQAIKLQ